MHRSLLLSAETDQKQLQRHQMHPCKPLMMILTGALTNVMLLLTPKKKKKSMIKCMKTLSYRLNDGELMKGLLLV